MSKRTKIQYLHLLRKLRREVACPTDTNSKVELVFELGSLVSSLEHFFTTLAFLKCGIFIIDAIENFRWYLDKHFCV